MEIYLEESKEGRREESNEPQKEKKYRTLLKKIDQLDIFACDLTNRFLSSDMIPLEIHEGRAPHLYVSALDGYEFMTKICFYPLSVPELYINVAKVISHSETEIRILTEMRKLLNDGYLKSIVRLIHTKTCQDITKMIADPDRCHLTRGSAFSNVLCTYNYQVKNGLALPRCSFLLLELCDMTLSAYLEKYVHSALNFDIFKSILFQILYTLYALTTLYPKFHHYDLHTDNIMLKFTKSYDEANPTYYKFKVGNQTYYVPQYGIKVKIIDFEFASIPELGLISVATKDRLIMFQRPNRDILLTLFWINYTLGTKSMMNNDIEAVLREIDPHQSYKNFNMAYVRSIEDKIPSYAEMIGGEAFKHYRQKREGKLISIKSVRGNS